MILLLGGTSESLEIADYLNSYDLPFILSVTTDYGADLAHQHAKYVSEGPLLPDQFHAFFKKYQIDLIIDATHPFARMISTHIIQAAQEQMIRYIRFERPDSLPKSPYLELMPDLDHVVDYLKKRTGIVYLSTGSKTAPEYAARLGVERLHVRVLPTTRVMTLLTKAGFEANQIDAIQGPFSTALNVELIKRTNAVAVVTKESGRAGGVQEKIAASQQLKIPCLVIKRPAIAYPEVVSTIKELDHQLEINWR